MSQPLPSKLVLVTNATNSESELAITTLKDSGKFIVKAFAEEQMDPTDIHLLHTLNIEVIRGSLMKKDDVVRAVRDTEVVFLNLDYPTLASKEFSIEKFVALFIETCKELKNVKHIVYTTITHAEKAERYSEIPKFHQLFKSSKMLKDSGLPVTELRIPFWMNKLEKFMELNRDENVMYMHIPMNNKPLDLLAMEDVGNVLMKILDNPKEWIGKSFHMVGDSLTPTDMTKIYQNVTGRPCKAKDISAEQFTKWYPHANAEEVAKMFTFFQENSGQLKKGGEKDFKLQDFETWLKNGHWGINTIRARLLRK